MPEVPRLLRPGRPTARARRRTPRTRPPRPAPRPGRIDGTAGILDLERARGPAGPRSSRQLPVVEHHDRVDAEAVHGDSVHRAVAGQLQGGDGRPSLVTRVARPLPLGRLTRSGTSTTGRTASASAVVVVVHQVHRERRRPGRWMFAASDGCRLDLAAARQQLVDVAASPPGGDQPARDSGRASRRTGRSPRAVPPAARYPSSAAPGGRSARGQSGSTTVRVAPPAPRPTHGRAPSRRRRDHHVEGNGRARERRWSRRGRAPRPTRRDGFVRVVARIGLADQLAGARHAEHHARPR